METEEKQGGGKSQKWRKKKSEVEEREMKKGEKQSGGKRQKWG